MCSTPTALGSKPGSSLLARDLSQLLPARPVLVAPWQQALRPYSGSGATTALLSSHAGSSWGARLRCRNGSYCLLGRAHLPAHRAAPSAAAAELAWSSAGGPASPGANPSSRGRRGHHQQRRPSPRLEPAVLPLVEVPRTCWCPKCLCKLSCLLTPPRPAPPLVPLCPAERPCGGGPEVAQADQGAQEPQQAAAWC